MHAPVHMRVHGHMHACTRACARAHAEAATYLMKVSTVCQGSYASSRKEHSQEHVIRCIIT